RELAVVHPDPLRADGAVRGARGRPRDARVERAPAALPPGLLGPALRPGVARPLLPRDRVPRPEVRYRGDRRVPEGPRRPRGQRGGEVTRKGSLFLVVVLAAAGAAACRQEMYDQGKYKPLGETLFFPDNRAPPLRPGGTVAHRARRG